MPRKWWNHTGKAEWEQRWVRLGWVLWRSTGASWREKGLLPVTLPQRDGN